MRAERLAAFGLALSIVLAACTGPGAPASSGTPSAASSVAGNSAFVYFDGSLGTLGDYEGTPLVVNFWASWCPSCISEMRSAFLPVQERLGDDIAFLGLNLQDDRDSAVAMVEETGVLFDLAEDPDGDVYVQLGGIGMPYTVFIDETGRIVDSHNGPLDEVQLETRIMEAFGE